MRNLNFKSDNHYRFENGRKTDNDNYGALRRIQINEENGIWEVSIYIANQDVSNFGDKIQMSPKKMKVYNSTKHLIQLKGIEELDYSDYFLEIRTTDENEIYSVKLSLLDRNVEIIYFQEENKEVIGTDFSLVKVEYLESVGNFYITSLKIDQGLPLLSNGAIWFNEPNGNEYYLFHKDYNILELNQFMIMSNNYIPVYNSQNKKLNIRPIEFNPEEILFVRSIYFE